ncbi:MAG: DUF1572 domain-containing protein [bacterium]|nr:DUF1572 domain-containing protein [bacterium]
MDSIGTAFIEHSRWRLCEDYAKRMRACLERLPDDAVWRRPNGASNSAGNLVLHLCGNVRQWAIHGLGGADDVRRRSDEFNETGPIDKAELIERLETTLREAGEVIAALDPSRLEEMRSIQGYDVTVLHALYHVVEHFSYHLGQVCYITKAFTGEDLAFFQIGGDGYKTGGRTA